MRILNFTPRLAAALLCAACARPGAARIPTDSFPSNALDDIVGTWQSDTTGGTSALSSCAWTPRHLAVVCDQRISMPDGTTRAVTNVFASRPDGGYVLYGITAPGAPLTPVPLAIENHRWVYGGTAPDDRDVRHRTVNDFTAGDTYVWRAESSTDGEHWTASAHGRSTRVRRTM
ncbi:MAG TPA: hypothetical protein VHB25_11850 [Gemmatimonadaceae bacterium]|nr:hypothetical protein [Gemmatimonadaceae bacterium]